jgi:hypothetical protein
MPSAKIEPRVLGASPGTLNESIEVKIVLIEQNTVCVKDCNLHSQKYHYHNFLHVQLVGSISHM